MPIPGEVVLTPATPALGYRPVRPEPNFRPTLFVIVDTEEEFDWGAPFSRSQTSVRSFRHIDRVQRVFERYGIVPAYVIDYPIASQPDAYERLHDMVRRAACVVGAHIHPWVNPPMDEEVTARNSFICNLPTDLQRAKLLRLLDEIEANIGVRGTIFKAGRYGVGVSTLSLLEELGFEVDVSINPHMDFSEDHGPSFEAFDAAPFSFGQTRRLLELPCTCGFAGAAAAGGPTLHRWASLPALRPLRAVGVLARTGIVNKIQLSPEGSSLQELKALTLALFARGIRTFSFTFHSPSVEPGHTPYVRSLHDLEHFLARIESYCEFFFGELGGTTSTPLAFKALVL